MTRKIPLYLGATALASVLGAPAFAQTVIIQHNVGVSPIPLQLDSNSAVVIAPGISVSSFEGQTAGTLYNVVGPTAAVGVSNPYTIDQAAGTYLIGTTGTSTFEGPWTGTIISDSVDSTSTNVLGAGNESFPALSNVAAGGSQTATNAVNEANIAPSASTSSTASTGSLTQVVGTADLVATNNMFAVVYNGSALVEGLGTAAGSAGFQSASDSLNTGGVFLTPPTSGTAPATDLVLLQKLTGDNDLTATNSAIAHSIASASLDLDPTVTGIAQGSQISVNQLSFGSGTTGSGTSAAPIPVTAVLDGSQNGVTQVFSSIPNSPSSGYTTVTSTPGMLSVVLGNTAVAYTGPFSTTYNLFATPSTPPGNGAASVSGVTQNATFGLNNVFGGAGVSLALQNTANTSTPPVGFLQTVDGSTLSLTGPTGLGGNIAPNLINFIVANVDGSGSATVANASQSFTNQQNVISVGGTLSGTATQSAVDFTPVSGFGALGYANLAAAVVEVGPASVTNVNQSLAQTLNYVAAGTAGSSLTLNQVAGGSGINAVSLGSSNLDGASGSSTATISGAVQLLNTSVNSAILPGSNGALTQTGTGVTLGNQNFLTAEANFSASVSGAQSAVSSLNVAVLGSLAGTVTQTATSSALSNTNSIQALSSYNASAAGNQVATSAINVIK